MLMLPLNATAPHWPCTCLKCGSGLRRLEKTLNFLRCLLVIDLVLKYGSDIDEGNSIQLLFYFIMLVGIVVSVTGMSFFQVCSRFYIEVFSYCSLTETYAIGFPKWFDNEWIDFGFFVGKWLLSSTFYLYGLKSARIAELLLFFEDIKFFRCSVRGVFWSVLQKWLFFFRHMILWYRLTSSRKAMQLYILSRFVVEPIFLGSSDKCLWLLLKTK